MSDPGTDEDREAADTVAGYRFELPPELIARHPPATRGASRLLVLRRGAAVAHRQFRDLLDLVNPGDCLVLNDTRVMPARLQAQKAQTGGRVEVLLVRRDERAQPGVEPAGGQRWIVLLQSSKKPKPGTRLVLPVQNGKDALFATVEAAVDDEPGAYHVVFEGDPVRFAAAHGAVPLPPYMEREPNAADAERYQTVYSDAQKLGSSAAPTAGLHFDESMLQALVDKGVRLARVTLHVGPGTFLPMRDGKLSDHVMHKEPWWLPAEAASALNATRAAGGRVIAVGTTSARVVESARRARDEAAGKDAPFVDDAGVTRLFLHPGNPPRAIDALITNFHLPESTLLVLVAAVVGRRRVLDAYAEAVAHGYRFYSYGDACFFEVDVDARANP